MAIPGRHVRSSGVEQRLIAVNREGPGVDENDIEYRLLLGVLGISAEQEELHVGDNGIRHGVLF